MSRGFVYVLSNPSIPGKIKIGKSSRCPHLRAKELSSETGVPQPFKVEYFAFMDGYDECEREVHDQLFDYRENKKREFFSADAQHAACYIREFPRWRAEDIREGSRKKSVKIHFEEDNTKQGWLHPWHKRLWNEYFLSPRPPSAPSIFTEIENGTNTLCVTYKGEEIPGTPPSHIKGFVKLPILQRGGKSVNFCDPLFNSRSSETFSFCEFDWLVTNKDYPLCPISPNGKTPYGSEQDARDHAKEVNQYVTFDKVPGTAILLHGVQGIFKNGHTPDYQRDPGFAFLSFTNPQTRERWRKIVNYAHSNNLTEVEVELRAGLDDHEIEISLVRSEQELDAA